MYAANSETGGRKNDILYCIRGAREALNHSILYSLATRGTVSGIPSRRKLLQVSAANIPSGQRSSQDDPKQEPVWKKEPHK